MTYGGAGRTGQKWGLASAGPGWRRSWRAVCVAGFCAVRRGHAHDLSDAGERRFAGLAPFGLIV
ncbi:unnamed protein product [Mycetohabitans rhizoxinica HKI 454]|uniref:Uncharacterized protein n=1 Tax=Mycetohabitans rhizoxinica (strain DSM 19002 / CIP 109453 / HKI 454) TaxID=882378 RepID=E5AQI7_MYCRK|nr:unnamed protein product [Mycetohabitans rhizoxinica HKI 454]